MRLSSRKHPFLTVAIAAACLLASVAGCGREGFTVPSGSKNSVSSSPSGPSTTVPAPVPTPGPHGGDLAICSALSLNNVIWPNSLDLGGRRSMALGLNISGSFEGSNGWKNITNNFDGQGLSLGLLNQCLGQGSLQPLLAKMRDQNGATMKAQFGSAHYSSLMGMLNQWQGTAKLSSESIEFVEDGLGDETLRKDGRLSDLDQLPEGADGAVQEESNSDSVAWAKSNLYTDGGKTFQPAWKRELQTMASHPLYVSLQIEKALALHNRAIAYMRTLRLHQLRSYLFLFDICVQNGSLSSADISNYNRAFPPGSDADEATRLKKMLSLRLSHVVDKYRSDVQARKLSIINGIGTVHGTSRNYPKEYCFNPNEKIL